NWGILVDKFNERLSNWKAMSLSFGGRFTIIKSVLGSLATSPISNGGLGIGTLKSSNLAMLSKWWWRFHTENHAFWCKIIRSIHGVDGGLNDTSLIKYKSGPWYRITKLKDELSNIGIDLPSIFKKKIGDGCSTHFWLDTWLGGSPLKDTFPRLFRLESNPACLVCNRCPTFHPLPHVSSAATSHSAPTPTPPRWSDLQLGLEQAHSVEFGAMFQNCAVLWPISAHLIMVIRGNLRTHGNALWNIPNITITNLLEGLNLADTVPITAASISFFDVVVQTTHWLLWRFRNNTTFATKIPNKQLIIDDVKLSSFTWISSRQKKVSIKWIEWICDPCNAISRCL
ncbi:hypothetical protein Tco_1469312, partial [Tanacetum coccineum]